MSAGMNHNMGEFRVGDLLQRNHVVDVWQGVHLETSTEVHVLIVNKTKYGHCIDSERVSSLIHKLKNVNHHNILKYHKIVQNDTQIAIIMEHPQGRNLRDYILSRPDRRLSEVEARVYFRQILSAVEFLHSHEIVHRNLNLRNIFVGLNSLIRMGDFVVCTKIGPMYKPHSSAPSNASYHFFAPEIWLEDSSHVGWTADIWSLGVLLYVMTCGCYPFDGKDEFDIFVSIKRGRFAIPNYISDECASLIKLMLRTDPTKRPTVQAISVHKWLNAPLRAPSSSLEVINEEVQGYPYMENNSAVHPQYMGYDFRMSNSPYAFPSAVPVYLPPDMPPATPFLKSDPPPPSGEPPFSENLTRKKAKRSVDPNVQNAIANFMKTRRASNENFAEVDEVPPARRLRRSSDSTDLQSREFYSWLSHNNNTTASTHSQEDLGLNAGLSVGIRPMADKPETPEVEMPNSNISNRNSPIITEPSSPKFPAKASSSPSSPRKSPRTRTNRRRSYSDGGCNIPGYDKIYLPQTSVILENKNNQEFMQMQQQRLQHRFTLQQLQAEQQLQANELLSQQPQTFHISQPHANGTLHPFPFHMETQQQQHIQDMEQLRIQHMHDTRMLQEQMQALHLQHMEPSFPLYEHPLGAIHTPFPMHLQAPHMQFPHPAYLHPMMMQQPFLQVQSLPPNIQQAQFPINAVQQPSNQKQQPQPQEAQQRAKEVKDQQNGPQLQELLQSELDEKELADIAEIDSNIFEDWVDSVVV